MWVTSVPILVFLGLSVLDLGPVYTTDVRQHHRLMPPPMGRGNNKIGFDQQLQENRKRDIIQLSRYQGRNSYHRAAQVIG